MSRLPELPPAPPLPDGVSPTDAEFLKAEYCQRLDAWEEMWKQQILLEAAAQAVSTARQDVDRATEAASVKAIEAAYIATSQSSLDRALTRVNVVTAAVAAIITLYTGLLGLVYTADSGKGNNHLSAVALIPGLFLGLALFLVAIYAALLKATVTVGPLLPTGIGGQMPELRLVTFMRWCFAGILQRSWALHAGIVSMGVGVFTLPVAFIALSGFQQVAILVVGLVAVVATALTTALTMVPAGSTGPQGE